MKVMINRQTNGNRMLDQKKQSGITLVLALIILLVLSIVVATSTQTVVMQEKMTSAVRDSHIALQIAEAGLVEAERELDLITGTTGFVANGANGLYMIETGPADIFDSNNWTSAKTKTVTVSYDVDGDGTNTDFEAQYFIEHLGILEEPVYGSTDINITNYGQTTGGGDVQGFRIVARATGMSGSAERVLIAYYGKRI